MRAQHCLGILGATAAVSMTLSVAAPPAAAAPVTVNFPSSDCPNTSDQSLQQCIDGVDPGSTVVLAAEIIHEGATIDKSLTLRATDRTLHPVLTGVAIDSPSSGAANIVVQDVRLRLGARIALTTGSGHSITMQRVDIGKGSPLSIGIDVRASVPASIAIENSFIRSLQGNEANALGVFTNDLVGLVSLRIVGNRITAQGDADSGAGIHLQMDGTGSMKADIYNNVIWDVATCNCGVSAGIGITPDATTKMGVNIVGNTIDNSATGGIEQRNDITTGRLSLDVFNNILSHNRGSGISLESGAAGTLVFRAGFNDFFADGPSFLDGQSGGSGNLHVDPLYLKPSAKDFRLASGSPLINKGSTCSPGGVADPDAAGLHRLRGPAVDIGAYEFGAAAITGVVSLGTSGPDILGGTAGDDILCGYGGKDVLLGRAGADYLDGGADADRLGGGPGVDRALGNTGDDLLCMRDNTNDFVDGGPDSDRADTDPGDTRISVEGSHRC